MLTPMIPAGARILLFKAQRPGDDRTRDLFSDLIDKEVQHKGYTDKEGHYHAPYQQRHKVRVDAAPQQPQAKAPEKPQAKPPAVGEAKQAAPSGLRYDPSVNRYNGQSLTRGDVLVDAKGQRYTLDRANGFMLTLDRQSDGVRIDASVDPFDKTRFVELTHTGKNQFDAPPAKADDAGVARIVLDDWAERQQANWLNDGMSTYGLNKELSDRWNALTTEQQDRIRARAEAQKRDTDDLVKRSAAAEQRRQAAIQAIREGAPPTAEHLAAIGSKRISTDRYASALFQAIAGGTVADAERSVNKRSLFEGLTPDGYHLRDMLGVAKLAQAQVKQHGVLGGRQRLAKVKVPGTAASSVAESVSSPQQAPASARTVPAAPAATAPQEGSTKTENGVTYVLRDGRWHRQSPETESATEPVTVVPATASAGFKIPPPPDDLDPSSPNYRYRDTGYVAGSRKEEAASLLRQAKRGKQRVRATAVDWEELEKNPREAKEVITKSHLFGVVDWDALKAGGMEPGAGFLVDRVYAAVGTAPKDDTAQARKDYALGLESLRDRLEGCKTPDQVTKVLDELRTEWDGAVLNAEETRKYAELTAERQRVLQPQQDYEKEARRLLDEATIRLDMVDRLKYAKQRPPEWAADLAAAKAEHEKAWAAAAKWKDDNPQFQEKSRDMGGGWTAYDSDVEWEARQIRNARNLIVTGAKLRNVVENPLHRAWSQMGDRFIAVLDNRGAKGSETFRKQVATAKAGRITDWSWAEKSEKTVAEPKGASEESTQFQLLVADKYERKGGRAVAVASTEALKQAFGLRDVQSGNWVLRDLNSAKFHVEHTAEAFADLADLIGAADRQVAMNGRLALAFGARGRGNAGFGGAARAHYESVQRIINLTKMGGGGSLAHEWFHAFDNLLKESLGTAADKDTYLTDDPMQLPPGELREAFVGLRAALIEGPHRQTRDALYTAADVRQAKLNMDRQNEYGMPAPAKLIKQAGNVHAATQAVDAFYDAAIARGPASKRRAYEMRRKEWSRLAAAYYGANPAGGVIAVESGPTMSSFRHEATKLDQEQFGKYWSQPRELAARAFQAWCEDRLQGQGRRNDYLSVKADNRHYQPDQKPFPEGEERTRINAAFDRLMQVVAREDLLTKALGGSRPVWLFFKAQRPGDDRTRDLFSDLIDKEVQHKGYTDKEGHYHAPYQQRHKVRMSSAPQQLQAKAPEKPQAATPPAKATVESRLTYPRDGDHPWDKMSELDRRNLFRSRLNPRLALAHKVITASDQLSAHGKRLAALSWGDLPESVRKDLEDLSDIKLQLRAAADKASRKPVPRPDESPREDPAKLSYDPNALVNTFAGVTLELVRHITWTTDRGYKYKAWYLRNKDTGYYVEKPGDHRPYDGDTKAKKWASVAAHLMEAGAEQFVLDMDVRLHEHALEAAMAHAAAHQGRPEKDGDTSTVNGVTYVYRKFHKWQWYRQDLLAKYTGGQSPGAAGEDLLTKALGGANPVWLFFKSRPKRRKRKVCMDADEFQREHERLVDVLRSPGHADDLREARKQAKEVRDGH